MHVFAAELAVAECDLAVGKRKKRVVFAQADVVARVPLGAALAHDDVAGANGFAAELLHAEALALAVGAVAGRTACFLMCHVELLRFRSLLGAALSSCSIFCRRTFGRALARHCFLCGGLFGAGGLVVGGRRVFGRLTGIRQRLMLFGGCLGP